MTTYPCCSLHPTGWLCTQPAGHAGPHIATTPAHEVCGQWSDQVDTTDAQTQLLRVIHRSDLPSYGLGALTATCALFGIWCALRIGGAL